MRRPRTHAAKIVTTFGAGLACAYLAPSAEGSIINLTPTPASVANGTGAFVHLSPASFAFFQSNFDQIKYFYAGAGSGFRFAPQSNVITTAQNFFNSVFQTAAAGTETWGFKTNANQVGWIRISFGGLGGPVTYLAAAYNDTPGGSIHAGTGASTTVPVPEPTSLALFGLASLAAGARGVRRLREKRNAQ